MCYQLFSLGGAWLCSVTTKICQEVWERHPFILCKPKKKTKLLFPFPALLLTKPDRPQVQPHLTPRPFIITQRLFARSVGSLLCNSRLGPGRSGGNEKRAKPLLFCFTCCTQLRPLAVSNHVLPFQTNIYIESVDVSRNSYFSFVRSLKTNDLCFDFDCKKQLY